MSEDNIRVKFLEKRLDRNIKTGGEMIGLVYSILSFIFIMYMIRSLSKRKNILIGKNSFNFWFLIIFCFVLLGMSVAVITLSVLTFIDGGLNKDGNYEIFDISNTYLTSIFFFFMLIVTSVLYYIYHAASKCKDCKIDQKVRWFISILYTFFTVLGFTTIGFKAATTIKIQSEVNNNKETI